MFVNRMVNDPEFRERVLSTNRAAKAEAPWAEVNADAWNKMLEDATPSPAVEDEDHARIDEIRVVAQALAFRGALRHDTNEIAALVNKAYHGEMAGQPEGFRRTPVVDVEMLRCMVDDPDCQWIIAEAPNGQDAVDDGAILGVCCYSIGGAAVKNSSEKVGAIRLLAVLPSFVGLCVGRRVLRRAEEAMHRDECMRCLCCVPDLRATIVRWFLRRGFERSSTAQFPEDLQKEFSRPAQLVVLFKNLAAGDVNEGVSSSGRREYARSRAETADTESTEGRRGGDATGEKSTWVFGERLPPEARADDDATEESKPSLPPPPTPSGFTPSSGSSSHLDVNQVD